MRLITDLAEFTPLKSKAILTIGNFDGLHLGHMELLSKMQKEEGEKIALTFSNHPIEVLKGDAPLLLLPLPERLKMLSPWIDTLILLPFSKELANLKPKEFLQLLLHYIPLSKLILGDNAALGRNREGNKQHIVSLASELKFETLFLAPLQIDQAIVSSSHIRKLIQKGHLDEAARFLGRRFSLSGRVIAGAQKGAALGFKTLNLSIEGLVHPPCGVYIVQCIHEASRYSGVANLGFAPTLRQSHTPLLEAHLFDFNQEIYEERVEIEFHKFLREECKFASIDALKAQIEQDIVQTHAWFDSQKSILDEIKSARACII